jgi:hypothetical protein
MGLIVDKRSLTTGSIKKIGEGVYYIFFINKNKNRAND